MERRCPGIYSSQLPLWTYRFPEFFQGFEKNNLAFLYQDETSEGKESRFSKLIDRRKGN